MLSALLAACAQSPGEDAHALRSALEHAAEARDPRVRAEDFQDAARRARWLSRPLSAVAPHLERRAFSWRGVFSLESTEGVAVARDERATLTLGASGDYALRHENRWRAGDEQGTSARACTRVGVAFFVGRDDAPPSRLEGADDQAAACLDSALEPITGWLALFDDRLAYAVDEAPAVHAGRSAWSVRAESSPERADGAAAVPIGAFFEAGARETLALQDKFDARSPLAQTHGRPSRLDVEMWVDDATGTPLSGRVDATFEFVKRGVPLTLRVEMSWTSTPSVDVPTVPPDAVHRGPRPRIFEDLRVVLGPIAASAPAGAAEAPLPAPGDAPPLTPEPERLEPERTQREARP
jgi:hypothetical protein